ncbi:MAG: hypothetical protein F6J97_10250 [Leptolyngbya sp. SIO4C1]|nr:hypothetical protein [Leptolyngbya sp. SIO4C1]
MKLTHPKSFGLFLIFALTAFLLSESSLYGLTGSLDEGAPMLMGAYAVRSVFLLGCSAIGVYLLHLRAKHQKQSRPLRFVNQPWSKPQMAIAAAAILLNFVFLLLLSLNPNLFSQLAQEDVLIEPLSAVFLFSSAAILSWQAWKLSRHDERTWPKKHWLIGGLGCLALIFFVIAMEEVSWFQRVAAFETPDAFSANLQSEFNLHNFATSAFEYLYYTGAFVYLIALPYLHLTSLLPAYIKRFSLFFGSSFTLCLSAILTAYNYDMWNAFPMQIGYFLTLCSLVSLYCLSDVRLIKRLCLIFLLTLLLTQAAFFAFGSQMSRLWDATEYKEFFIALGFFAYSLDVRRKLARSSVQQPFASEPV